MGIFRLGLIYQNSSYEENVSTRNHSIATIMPAPLSIFWINCTLQDCALSQLMVIRTFGEDLAHGSGYQIIWNVFNILCFLLVV